MSPLQGDIDLGGMRFPRLKPGVINILSLQDGNNVA
jgi:hypothetical protein